MKRSLFLAALAAGLTLAADAKADVILSSWVKRTGTTVELRPATFSGWRYRIEGTSDFTAWDDLGQAETMDGLLTCADPNAERPHRFYRIAIPRARMLVPFALPNLPEGLAMDAQGNAFVSMAATGEILKITPNGTATRLAQLPALAAGLAVDPQNNLLVCVATQPTDPAQHGIWKITPDGQASRWAALPPDAFPNDVTLDAAGRVFVTDSIGGRVFRIDSQGQAEVWLASALLAGAPNPQPPHPPFPIGANGMVFVENQAFVNNTDLGTIVRVPVNADGSAGAAEVFMGGPLLGGADGLEADAVGNLYVANVIQSLVIRVTPQRQMQVIASGQDGLDSPSSLGLGPLGAEVPRLYVVNYATISAAIPGAQPKPGFLAIRRPEDPAMETLALFTPPQLPEGLAVDRQGHAYLSMIQTGEILKIAPDGTRSVLVRLAPMVVGLTIDAAGDLYVGVAAAPDPTQHGVWRVKPDGTATLFASLPLDAFPNDVAFDSQGRLFVTDNVGGRIFEIGATGDASVWLASPLLTGLPDPQPPHPPFPIGVNGLVFFQANAFACNTDRGTVVRIPVLSDGAAGEPVVIAEDGRLLGADGLKIDRNGSLYLANVIQSTLLRLTPRGEIETLATAGQGLDSPSSLCFGSGALNEWLYLVNYATISAGIPGAPSRPALLRYDAGVPAPTQ